MTEDGFGKRTRDRRVPADLARRQGRQDDHVHRAPRALLAGALVVREHQELVFISQNGMVQRTSVRGINRYGRASQGVKVMNLREGDEVSAVALVVESDTRRRRRRDAEIDAGSTSRPVDPIDDADDAREPPRRRTTSGAPRGVRPDAGGADPAPGSLLSGSPEKGGGPKLSDSSCGTLEVPGR